MAESKRTMINTLLHNSPDINDSPQPMEELVAQAEIGV